MKNISKYLLITLALFITTVVINTTSTIYASDKTGTVTIFDRTNRISKTYHHAKIRLLTARAGADGITGGDLIIITSSGKRIRPSVTAQVTYTRGATYNSEINGTGER